MDYDYKIGDGSMTSHQWAYIYENYQSKNIKNLTCLPVFVKEYISKRELNDEDLRSIYYCERCQSISFYSHYGAGSNWYEDCDITIIESVIVL